MKHYKVFRFILTYLLIISWVFSSWPRAQEANALNRINNWNFNGSASGWSTTNGTATAGVSGAFSCFTSTDNTTNNMATFAYNANLGGQTAFEATSGAVKNTDYRGYIYVTTTAPGSGIVKTYTLFDYYRTSTAWGSALISMDYWNATNSVFSDFAGCVALNQNGGWTRMLTSTVNLTGGTTYTVRINLVTKTKSNANVAITLGVDNIQVNFAPTGLAAAAIASTTKIRLDWTTSTAGTGANGLHATAPYKIYGRTDTSGPYPLLSVTSTNFFFNTSTTGNTTTYYYITDVDTVNFESPSSSEVSILSLPDVPGTPSFSNVAQNSLTVSWTAPTGGSPTYLLERAPDSGGAPGSFSQITSTIDTSYGDSGLSASAKYWYRVRGNNATGNGAYSANNSTTTLAASTVSCSTAGTSTSFGALSTGSVSTAGTISTTTFSCTYPSGCTLNIKDAGNGSNGGLSTTPSYLIPSPNAAFDASATLVAGTEGYGIQAATTSAGSGGNLTLAARYLQTGNTVGGLKTTDVPMASSTGSITDREVVVTHKAAISALTQAGTYEDTITYSCVGN